MKKSSCGSLASERRLVRQKPTDGGAICESPTADSRTKFLTGSREGNSQRVLMAPPSPSLSRARSAPEESARGEVELSLAPTSSSTTSVVAGTVASGSIGGAGSFDGCLLSMPPLFASPSSQCYTATAVDCRRTAMSMSGSSSPSRSGLLFGGGGGVGGGGGAFPTCSYRRRGSALSCSGSSSVSISFGFWWTTKRRGCLQPIFTSSLRLSQTKLSSVRKFASESILIQF